MIWYNIIKNFLKGGSFMNVFLDYYDANYSYRESLLYHFKDKGEIIRYNTYSFIEFEHKKLYYVYLIIDGKVKQYFIDYSGAEKTILLLSSGDMFGEITMIQEDYNLVITETLSPTTVCKINKDTFYSVLQNNPAVYNDILLMVTTKFRILMAQIYDFTFYNVKNRLYFLLQRLAIQQGTQVNNGTQIDLKLTHQELATMIGSTRSTVTRMLNELEEEGKIQRYNSSIIIFDEKFTEL